MIAQLLALLRHLYPYLVIHKLFNKHKPQLKHIITCIKLFNVYYLVYVCYFTCCKSCVTLNILTTVKLYDDLLRKVKIDHYVCKIGLLKIKIK